MSTATTSAPAGQRKPRPRPARSVSLLVRPEGSVGVVRITVGDDRADYFLTELAADFGRGFLVEKIGTDSDEPAAYHVNLDGGKRSCECKGFCRWGHCKHADG